MMEPLINNLFYSSLKTICILDQRYETRFHDFEIYYFERRDGS